MSLLELFCDVDDFWQTFEPIWQQQQLASGEQQRIRATQLSMSEMMTIMSHFHQSGYRTFKRYYNEHVIQHLGSEFPKLVSYQRFVELMPCMCVPLTAYLLSQMGTCTGIAFVDATPLAVCHNRRIHSHKVFAGLAERGKTSMGWFYGFKLHLVVNDRGELLAFRLTPGNVDDRKPVPAMTRHLFGKLFGDKGYISKSLHDALLNHDLFLITGIRRNMKNKLMSVVDKILLRKRALIESINDQLKNFLLIDHSRHRSPNNFLVNLLAGLIAYCHQPKKPSLRLSSDDISYLPA